MKNQVDVIIACHSTKRRLERCISSVLSSSNASPTVVAHNISVEELQGSIPQSLVSKTNWLSLQDGVRSPANPYNYGTQMSKAEWVSLLGSDDFLQDRAIDAWLSQSEGADAVITRLVHDDGSIVRTPPICPVPSRFRNAVKDRLYYRSAPLGLMRRDFLKSRGLQWDPGMSPGGDLRLSTLLWSQGNIKVQTGGPGYVIGSDAGDRVTMSLATVEQELRHLFAAWGANGWVWALTPAQLSALAVKYLRIHIFGTAFYRAKGDQWESEDRQVLANAVNLILSAVPLAEQPLSIADRKLLDALKDPSVPNSVVSSLASARRKFGRPETLVPKNLSYLLHREAPPRFMVASALVR